VGIEKREPGSLVSRLSLGFLCLVAAFAYRASVSWLPYGAVEVGFLLGLSALFLLIAVLSKRSTRWTRYWEIPFAFFVFTIAGLAGDANVSPLQRGFVTGVLHETPSANNPLASTVLGTVLAQLFATLCMVVPIIVLTRLSGADLGSIFISRGKGWAGPVISVVGFLAFFLVVSSGRAESFFPNHGITPQRFLALAPALLVLVLCNGLREELWFRGLFLKKYQAFLGGWPSNLLAGIIFTSFHVQVQYALHLLPFLVFTLVLGLFLGWLMQRSQSVIWPALFHAGSDLPIFIVYLSYAT